MNQSKIEALYFPVNSYLVFVLGNGGVRVILSNDISYEEDIPNLFSMESQPWIKDTEYQINLLYRELFIGNKLINNVCWFSVSKGKLLPLVYESRVSIFHYLISLFTLGIGGCFFLNRKNKDLLRVADNWFKSQQDCCSLNQWKTCAESIIQHFLGGKELCLKNIESFKDLHDFYLFFDQLKNSVSHLKDQLNLLGQDFELQVALQLRNKYGSFENIEKTIEGLFLEKDDLINSQMQLGTSEEIEAAILLKRAYGSFDRLKLDIDEFTKLKNNYGSIFFLEKKISDLEMWQENAKLEMNKRLNDLGGESGIQDIFDLRDRYGSIKHASSQLEYLTKRIYELEKREMEIGGIKEMERILALREKYGSFSFIGDRLLELEKLNHFQHRIQELEAREIRWMKLSKGKSLEHLEEQNFNNESENRTKKGLEFEDQIEQYLQEISNNETENDVSWTRHYSIEIKGKSKKYVDFWIEFNNRAGARFNVAVECKRGQILEDLEPEEGRDNNKLLKDGIKQLCEYCCNTVSHMGLLVTNGYFEGLSTNIRFKRILPKDMGDYANQNLNLLLVHESAFALIMIIIKFVNNIYEPDETITIEDRRSHFGNYRLHQFLSKAVKCSGLINKNKDLFSKKLKKTQDDLNTLVRYWNNHSKYSDELLDTVNEYRDDAIYNSEDVKLLQPTKEDIEVSEVDTEEE